MNNNDLSDRLIGFSANIIEISKNIEFSYTGKYISQQLIRSSISPSLNYAESRSSESMKDFVHKMKIVIKELRESLASLQIIQKSKLSNDNVEIEEAIQECNELISIFIASIKTCQHKLEKGG